MTQVVKAIPINHLSNPEEIIPLILKVLIYYINIHIAHNQDDLLMEKKALQFMSSIFEHELHISEFSKLLNNKLKQIDKRLGEFNCKQLKKDLNS